MKKSICKIFQNLQRMKKKLIKRLQKGQEGFNLSKVTGGNAAAIGAANPLASKQGLKNYNKLIKGGMDEDKALNVLSGNYFPGMVS